MGDGLRFPSRSWRRNVTYSVVDCVSTPGTPKADFHFITENGDACLWTSHKHGTDATHFQQWGGMSQRREPEVHAHEEVQSFIEDVKSKYPEGLPNKTSLFRRIKSDDLKMMSAYGNAFGSGAYGPPRLLEADDAMNASRKRLPTVRAPAVVVSAAPGFEVA